MQAGKRKKILELYKAYHIYESGTKIAKVSAETFQLKLATLRLKRILSLR